MSHTPGPWVVSGQLVIAPRGQGVDEVITGDCYKADACLIAAAPELLELLKQFVSDIEECDPIYPSWIDAARVTIAKAEGK